MKKQFLAMGALLAAVALSAHDASAQRRVLVFGPGGQAAINDLRANVPAVRDAGPTQGQFTIATEAMWRAMTTAQFAAYHYCPRLTSVAARSPLRRTASGS